MSSQGDFALSLDELRAVARFAVRCAERVLPLYEEVHPDDGRPRAAVDAARVFAGGAPRTRLQRVTALEAHRAAKGADTDVARHAAAAAGDAAAAAYLHPIARATQVGHILRAAAHAAAAVELAAGGDPSVGDRVVREAALEATDEVVDVLRRYPEPPTASSRVARLMKALDGDLRSR